MKKICIWWLLAVFAFAGELRNTDMSAFEPVAQIGYDEQKARLGKKLFFDKRLSRSESYSCETCHNLYWDFSGTSRRPQGGTVNPPSVLNSALNYIFFHDGRVRNIYDQVRESIVSREQLNSDEKRIVAAVEAVAEYKILFERTYRDGINFENIVDAIVEFERAVATVNSPFDRYLLGDSKALSKDEQRGLALFSSVGCVACHNGKNIGGNLLQEINFSHDILSGTQKEGKKLYRVPSLRNIVKTAPYFSDGSTTRLKETITHVSHIQLTYELSEEQSELIYKFLLSLSGERPRILNESSSN